MNRDYFNIPNIITSIRFFGALVILFLKPFSLLFFIIFFIAGFTDCIDGFLARKLNSVTDFGSKLDSVCDLVFYIVLFIKIMPYLISILPTTIWYFVAIVLITRIALYIYAGTHNKGLISNHTYLNKITGVMIYLLPFVSLTKYIEEYAWLTVIISMLAVFHEIKNYHC